MGSQNMRRTKPFLLIPLILPSRRTGVLTAVVAGLLLSGLLARTWAEPHAPAQPLKLNAGDHIAIIGNTLPDRMQHDAASRH